MNAEILSKTNYLKANTLEDDLKPLLANIERLRPMIATLSKVDTRFIELESLYLTGLTSLSDLSHTLQAATIDDKAAGRKSRDETTLKSPVIPGSVKSKAI